MVYKRIIIACIAQQFLALSSSALFLQNCTTSCISMPWPIHSSKNLCQAYISCSNIIDWVGGLEARNFKTNICIFSLSKQSTFSCGLFSNCSKAVVCWCLQCDWCPVTILNLSSLPYLRTQQLAFSTFRHMLVTMRWSVVPRAWVLINEAQRWTSETSVWQETHPDLCFPITQLWGRYDL